MRLQNIPFFEREIGRSTIDFDKKGVCLVKHTQFPMVATHGAQTTQEGGRLPGFQFQEVSLCTQTLKALPDIRKTEGT
jgi:hypothetical protein